MSEHGYPIADKQRREAWAIYQERETRIAVLDEARRQCADRVKELALASRKAREEAKAEGASSVAAQSAYVTDQTIEEQAAVELAKLVEALAKDKLVAIKDRQSDLQQEYATLRKEMEMNRGVTP